MKPELVIPVFIVSCVFVAILLTMYLLTEMNLTHSYYGIRRFITQKSYDDIRYKNWLERKEPELKKLYEEEFCNEMVLTFKQFCMAIYEGKEIIYKDVNKMTLQDSVGVALLLTAITWCVIKTILVW